MTLHSFSAMCNFVKKGLKKTEYVLFMSDFVYQQEFAFIKESFGDGISIKTPIETTEHKSIVYNGVTFYIVDPATL